MPISIPLVDSLLNFGGKLIDRLIPDPAQKLAALQEMQKMADTKELAYLAADTDLAKGQLEINTEEAKSSSIFVSGWRPFIGWICGVSLLYVAILEPVARFTATVGFSYLGSFPAIDTTITMQVLIGMLGLGAFRTHEKVKRVA